MQEQQHLSDKEITDDLIIGKSTVLNEFVIRMLQLKEFIFLLSRSIFRDKYKIEKRLSFYWAIRIFKRLN